MTQEHFLSLAVLLCGFLSSVQAQEKGSAEAARILAGSQRIMSAGLQKVAVQREESAKATPAKDKTLIATIVAKLSANNSSINYYFAEDLGTAGVGAVMRIRPYNFVGLEGTSQLVQPSARVLSVEDNANAIVEYHSNSLADEDKIDFRRFWLHGADTSAYADRDVIPLDGFFVINGSQKYEAANGTLQTVLRLELINVKPYLDEMKRMADEKVAQEKAAALANREASFRTWKSTNGNHSVEARAASYANGSVTLEMRDGKKVKVELTKLSDADQAYLTKWRRKSTNLADTCSSAEAAAA